MTNTPKPQANTLDEIFNEDCLETMARMKDNSVDLVFTSPPYNRERNDVYSHYDDTIKDYFAFLVKFTDESLRVSKTCLINIQANYYNKADLYRYMGHYADKIQHTFVWTKENPMPASGNNITNAFEYVFMIGDNTKSNGTYTKNHVHTAVNPDTDKSHGAIMNIKIAKHFINLFTKERGVVYDPFMGTGTTARACKDLGRHYIGSEISKEYCDIAKKRLGQGVLL